MAMLRHQYQMAYCDKVRQGAVELALCICYSCARRYIGQHMFKRILATAALMLISTAAYADKVTITNNSDRPIFKLYAWPTDMGTRTLNLLGAALFPRSSADIDVDNSYGDCQFTFQYDPNDPFRAKKRGYRRMGLTAFDANICRSKMKVGIGG